MRHIEPSNKSHASERVDVYLLKTPKVAGADPGRPGMDPDLPCAALSGTIPSGVQ